jgi:hypothetical protein
MVLAAEATLVFQEHARKHAFFIEGEKTLEHPLQNQKQALGLPME